MSVVTVWVVPVRNRMHSVHAKIRLQFYELVEGASAMISRLVM